MLFKSYLPLVIVILLLDSYTRHQACTVWDISDGMKQGGVICPRMFIIYIFQLLLSGIGCHIHGKYMGILGYADDDLVLALEAGIKCYIFVKNLENSILFNFMAINQGA